MHYPTVEMADRTLLILVGPEADLRKDARRTRHLEWRDLPASERLRQTALKNPDAVAFSFACGRWFAAA